MDKTFNEKCYQILKNIPRGKVTTYKEIANALNSRAYRRVGNAMKKNHNKKIKCYKVINSNGCIGGFNRGVKEKIGLLEKEGIEINNNKIDLKKYGFKFKH